MGCTRSKLGPPKGDYKVTLERTCKGQLLGMTVVGMSDNSLRVDAIKPKGLISAWNNEQHSLEAVVNRGDFIMSVNGVYGDVDAMRSKLQEEVVYLVIKRVQKIDDEECVATDFVPIPGTSSASSPSEFIAASRKRKRPGVTAADIAAEKASELIGWEEGYQREARLAKAPLIVGGGDAAADQLMVSASKPPAAAASLVPRALHNVDMVTVGECSPSPEEEASQANKHCCEGKCWST
eukprot:TRINITY_DN42228_c0_g1_i1.p1 TRINITY_DN42228_c0_g1~~TRINITY_DN42228_c0_g1_i1.p1  ORF type:complete len:237 (-),score=56.51 TRINITY_DN42228_c0_g1_i1:121-831(-)